MALIPWTSSSPRLDYDTSRAMSAGVRPATHEATERHDGRETAELSAQGGRMGGLRETIGGYARNLLAFIEAGWASDDDGGGVAARRAPSAAGKSGERKRRLTGVLAAKGHYRFLHT
jgi:hypothetical protein